MAAWDEFVAEWQDYFATFFAQGVDQSWAWFNSLNREEWLIVMAVCCAGGFLFLKSWGHKGPC
jgi:hypothetical protein